ETFARLMEINYLGTVWTIRAALPAMRRRGEGWIVNVSSVAGKLGQPDESAYTASKFAVTGLSEALACELAPLGIHVMTVYPASLLGRLPRAGCAPRWPRPGRVPGSPGGGGGRSSARASSGVRCCAGSGGVRRRCRSRATWASPP